jgi:hypothetical protein
MGIDSRVLCYVCGDNDADANGIDAYAEVCGGRSTRVWPPLPLLKGFGSPT